MTSFSTIVQIVSIVSIVVPIGICVLAVKTAGSVIRLFFAFLIIGLLTDMTMYALLHTGHAEHLPIIFNVYSLVEALFFYWLIFRNSRSRALTFLTKIMLLVTPFFWLIFILLFPSLFVTKDFSSQVFDTTYEVIIAFMAGFILLKIVETNESVSTAPEFWILLGVFFYCFCTFFIMGFLNTLFSQNIWFLNNIINIITYVFYSIGMWKSRSKNHSTTK